MWVSVRATDGKTEKRGLFFPANVEGGDTDRLELEVRVFRAKGRKRQRREFVDERRANGLK